MAKKIALVVVALLLVIGVSIGTILLMDKTAVPASTTIENGLSAYELAVQYGYEGTVQEWLESLNGKSAYEIAVENGYPGTQDEWGAAINAAATQSAVSITTAKFSSKGELIIVLSDGTELNVGKAVGADGKNGTNGKNWHATHFFDDPLSNDFHTYGVEWCQEEKDGKDCIRFFVDGVEYATVWETLIDNPRSWPFTQPHFIILNCAIGGNMGGRVDDSIFNQQRIMYVDWVRVYQRQEQP